MLRIEARPHRESWATRTGEKLLRFNEKHIPNQYADAADTILKLEDDFRGVNLKEKSDELRNRLHGREGYKKESLDAILPEAFALVREAADRTLHMKHNKQQIMTGLALHNGQIAEMKTGEGKTLAATLPAYLNALMEQGVHVITANNYLAKRDAENMGKVYDALGLSVGLILPDNPENPNDRHPPAEHRDAYNSHITYGTIDEFGFDHLRDNMVSFPEDIVQRGHYFTIVDEADSIMIDKARVPLILTEHNKEDLTSSLKQFAKIVKKMNPISPGGGDDSGDYEVFLNDDTVDITPRGLRAAEIALGIDDITTGTNSHLQELLFNALYAKELKKRDKHYIVKDDKIYLVDQNTGRILYGHRFSDGLHPALEAKERVTINPENETLASISIQNYLRLYQRLSGMTGTAESDSKELAKTYRTEVVKIPTHNDLIRDDHPLIVYKTEKAKFHAIVDEIIERHDSGQPILVGTISVEKSEILEYMLKRRRPDIKVNLLNAKSTTEDEARIVAEAGKYGAVTIGTNMVGRGTDIQLGGDPDVFVQDYIAQIKLNDTSVTDFTAHEKKARELWKKFVHQKVMDVGGLCVIGTELSESQRIDNQLRGRAGRQGEPGESLFFASLEDDITTQFRPTVMANLQKAFANVPEYYPLISKRLSKNFVAAQIETQLDLRDQRKNVFEYDRTLDEHRKRFYTTRTKILTDTNLQSSIDNLFTIAVDYFVADSRNIRKEEEKERKRKEREEEKEETRKAKEEVRKTKGIDTEQQARPEPSKFQVVDAEFLADMKQEASQYWVKLAELLGFDTSTELDSNELLEKINSVYAARELTPSNQGMLTVLDQNWRTHLMRMDFLKDAVPLRKFANRDPFVEYHEWGEQYLNGMIKNIVLDLLKAVGPRKESVPNLIEGVTELLRAEQVT